MRLRNSRGEGENEEMNVDDEPNEPNESEYEEYEEATSQEDEEVIPQIALIDSEYEPNEDENPTVVTSQIISSNSEPEAEPERESSVTPQAPITTIAESTESIVGSPPEEQSSKAIVRKRKTAPTTSTPPIAKHIRY